MKHKLREEKKSEQRIGLAVTITILIMLIVVSGFFINSMLNQPSTNQATSDQSQPRAAIVDQLSLTIPNTAFIETATNTLKQAGYEVDYYPGEKVTVEFYRNLATHNYEIIILRVHSALRKGTEPPVALFTSESYSQYRYVPEQLAEKLTIVHYDLGGEEQLFFGIVPNFVKSSMNGRFQNSIIIMMGCNGLTYTDMASAFVERGAKVYIGWDLEVSASQTDQATTELLHHLLVKKQTIRQAVVETMEEVESDTVRKSQLIAYPKETWEYTIQTIPSNPTTKP